MWFFLCSTEHANTDYLAKLITNFDIDSAVTLHAIPSNGYVILLLPVCLVEVAVIRSPSKAVHSLREDEVFVTQAFCTSSSMAGQLVHVVNMDRLLASVIALQDASIKVIDNNFPEKSWPSRYAFRPFDAAEVESILCLDLINMDTVNA